jgi:hypothetical protein
MPPVRLSIRNSWVRYRALPAAPRELVTFGLCLVLALSLLPLCIWTAGHYFLGDYLRDPSGTRTGGVFALLADYVRGVVAGSPGHGMVLLGPYGLLVALRLARAIVKL